MKTKNKFKASDVYKYMVVGKRAKSGDTYYYFSDDTPELMRETWQELSGQYDDYNFSDLEEYYNVLYTLVQLISEHEQYGGKFTEDELYSIDWADDYHGERLMWLYNNLSRASVYDNIKNNGADGIYELIGDMQDFSRGELASYIYNNFLEV